MNIPFEYIVISIMNTLKNRNMELSVSIDVLIKYIKGILKELNIEEEKLRELIFDFNIGEEIDSFIQDYYEYFDFDDDKIVFDLDNDPSIIDGLLNNVNTLDNDMISELEEITEDNTKFLSILGIDIDTKLYDTLYRIEKKLEDNYSFLCFNEEDDVVINKIKRLHLISNTILYNMNNIYSDDEMDDFILYSDEITREFFSHDYLDFKIKNSYVEKRIFDNPLDRTIFVVEPVHPFTLRDKIEINYYKHNIEDEDWYKGEELFYVTFLNLLDREIEKNDDFELKTELILTKKRLMNVIDSLFGTFTFLGNYDKNNDYVIDNYKFMPADPYYLVNDILEYSDNDYVLGEDRKNIVRIFYNIIKKLYVESYYILSNDSNIKNIINDNKLYGVNKFSSDLFSDIMKKNKKKIK